MMASKSDKAGQALAEAEQVMEHADNLWQIYLEGVRRRPNAPDETLVKVRDEALAYYQVAEAKFVAAMFYTS
jgi:hypothetical protein